MSWTTVADWASALFLLGGAILCLAASLGLLRFPELISRMHAATKPQTLGVLFVLLGVELRLRSLSTVPMLLLVAAFQLMTSPLSSHMMARSALRIGQTDSIGRWEPGDAQVRPPEADQD
ncbi:monovalent cation/H(+) antiporter subunit G [Arsenicicoccus piscis]|uniref:Na+/H+ antiporter subunit G n=1 Tax=Arsenicicoccus piscis TaxID=673954 RepID=A0ABQ6HQT0_9MICO|nr:monovalent cation/H(+) antiporter subunit G [Arsenicicoccus piscis]MCH8626228.1 monovalent cation/H(+) antiporter subunit G [Arsenicicoccus piscis]GMA20818.1 Na+/H+ antiporter subunit G [Arsenicicoccus piscis]